LGQLVHELLQTREPQVNRTLKELRRVVVLRLNHLYCEHFQPDVGKRDLVAPWHSKNPLDVSHRPVGAGASVDEFVIIEELFKEAGLGVLIEGVGHLTVVNDLDLADLALTTYPDLLAFLVSAPGTDLEVLF
jgi:hypothetical protein